MDDLTLCPIPTENPIILNLTNSSGALLIGSFLSCIVWGISSMQTWALLWIHSGDPYSTWSRFLYFFQYVSLSWAMFFDNWLAIKSYESDPILLRILVSWLHHPESSISDFGAKVGGLWRVKFINDPVLSFVLKMSSLGLPTLQTRSSLWNQVLTPQLSCSQTLMVFPLRLAHIDFGVRAN